MTLLHRAHVYDVKLFDLAPKEIISAVSDDVIGVAMATHVTHH